MKHSIFLICLVVLAGYLLTGCSTQKTTNDVSDINIQDRQKIELVIGKNNLQVEAVTSMASIETGLGNRDQIGSDGMLFFLPEKRVATFWMKDMRFDLDMVWILDTVVVGIESNVPALKNASEELHVYSSPEAVNLVLELPAGDADKRGIKTGDSVHIIVK